MNPGSQCACCKTTDPRTVVHYKELLQQENRERIFIFLQRTTSQTKQGQLRNNSITTQKCQVSHSKLGDQYKRGLEAVIVSNWVDIHFQQICLHFDIISLPRKV